MGHPINEVNLAKRLEEEGVSAIWRGENKASKQKIIAEAERYYNKLGYPDIETAIARILRWQKW